MRPTPILTPREMRAMRAPQYAEAIRLGLTSRGDQATPVEIVLDPTTRKPAGAFVISCPFGRFVVTIAELQE